MGVEKIKTIGDAYMAACGVPTPNKDHAEIMLRFAVGMYKDLAEYNKTAKIKPTLVLKDSSKKAVTHAAKFRYQSTNTKVATVDKNGKITAVGKGTCTIYIFANNGKLKSVKVTVK